MVITGRLQPLHMGHIELWRRLAQEFDEHLVICILRQTTSIVATTSLGGDSFLTLSAETHGDESNPLPNFTRLRLVQLAIRNDSILANRATPLLRDRPDISWDSSLRDLPSRRVWVFNVQRSDLDRSKPAFYKSKGELVREVSFGTLGNFEARNIRLMLRSGSRDLSFLPENCRDYFQASCLPHVISQVKV